MKNPNTKTIDVDDAMMELAERHFAKSSGLIAGAAKTAHRFYQRVLLGNRDIN